MKDPEVAGKLNKLKDYLARKEALIKAGMLFQTTLSEINDNASFQQVSDWEELGIH